MTIPRLARRLVSIVRPPSPRLALLISRAVTRRELELYSLIFDEIIVADSTGGAANEQEAAPHILYATRAAQAMRGSESARLNSGSAIWVQRGCVGAIAIRLPASDEIVTLFLRRGADSTAGLEPLELDANDIEARPGAVSSGNLQSIRCPDDAEFLLVNEDESLLRTVAKAARADIESRIFFGPTGLEP